MVDRGLCGKSALVWPFSKSGFLVYEAELCHLLSKTFLCLQPIFPVSLSAVAFLNLTSCLSPEPLLSSPPCRPFGHLMTWNTPLPLPLAQASRPQDCWPLGLENFGWGWGCTVPRLCVGGCLQHLWLPLFRSSSLSPVVIIKTVSRYFPWWSSGYNSALSMWRAQVRSLVREIPYATTKTQGSLIN